MVIDFSHIKQLIVTYNAIIQTSHNHYHVVLIIIDNVELHWTSLFINTKWI